MITAIGFPQALDHRTHIYQEIAQGEIPVNEKQESTLFQDAKDSSSRSSDGSVAAAAVSNCEESDDGTLLLIDDAIERIGMGRFQYQVIFAVGLCFAADAMEVLLLSFLSIILRHEWELSDRETAMITSILFAGTTVGTLILGALADKVGRRPIFLVSSFIISAFGVCTALAPSYLILEACIFVVGFGIGGVTVPYDTLAELIPCAARGKYLNLINYFWSGGCLFVVVLAYLTLGTEHTDDNDTDNHRNWRLFVAICSLPCFLSLLIGYFMVPESPRWLCSQDRLEEAVQILRTAARINGRENVDQLIPIDVILVAEEEKSTSVCELFQPRWREITLRLWGVWFGFAFGYFGTVMAVTRVFQNDNDSNIDHTGDFNETASFNLADENYISTNTNVTSHQSYSFDYTAIFISTSAELVGASLGFLVDRVGRIPLQVVTYTLAGISVFALCAGSSIGLPREVLICFGFLARVFEMTSSCVSWTLTAELLTTEIRSTGHSAANSVARIGAFFSPFVVQGNLSMLQIGLIMLCTHTFTVLCVMRLPETAGRAMGANNNNNDNTTEEDVYVLLDPETNEIDSSEDT